MARQNEFVSHVLELLTPLGPATSRAMFGGWGIYLDGVMFALVADDTLYFKADDNNRASFLQAGLEPFRYVQRGKQISFDYFSAPDEAFDAPHLMLPWARLGLAAALRARAVRRR
jgi:DNA transformation protein